jgi:hypothetical protein
VGTGGDGLAPAGSVKRKGVGSMVVTTTGMSNCSFLAVAE